MKKPIRDEAFWRERLNDAIGKGELHKTVYETTADDMRNIDNTHREIFYEHISTGDFVLDAGCGYGRAVPLLPGGISYVGVDLSPDLIRYARETFREGPTRQFINDDLLPFLKCQPAKYFNVGFCISMKQMFIGNGYGKVWEKIEVELIRACHTVIILEYDSTSKGEIIRG